MSWDLDTAALRTTTAAAITQSACDKGSRVCSNLSAVCVMVATIARRIEDPKNDATNQNRNSSLLIRLDNNPLGCQILYGGRVYYTAV